MDPAIIQKEALLLPETQRALLADRLLASLQTLPDELTEAWVAEARDRLDAYRAGEIEAVDGPTAISSLKNRFAR